MPIVLPFTPVIELAFDPVTQVGDWLVRIQTLALALVVFVALVFTALLARRTPVDLARSADDSGPDDDNPNHLRRDDLLFIVVAAIPGAVIGGRIGYALTHLGYYSSTPGALLDIGQGGFELSMAVVGGTLTAAIIATLLGAPLGRWMHASILPLLFAIAGGKLAMVLGGEGQGVPFDGAWATAYLGPGPWLSLAPALSSNPSQAYEGLATIAILVVLGVLLARGAFPRKSGGAFFLGLALWSIARLLVAFTWRDPAVIGPFGADQVLSIAVAGVALGLLVSMSARVRGPGTDGAQAAEDQDLDWPDPATRPQI